MARWGMVIDLEKCVGCQACSSACGMENNRLPGENWQDVLFYTEGDFPSGKLTWLPRPCMHCETPSCKAVCPTGATYKTEDGVVLVDWDKCIGCKYCMIACPYGVRYYGEEKQKTQPDIRKVFPGSSDKMWNPPWQMPEARRNAKWGVGIQPTNVVSKCTFCYHRVSQAPKGTVDLDPDDPKLRDFTPACVVACPASARYFGDIDNPQSRVRELMAVNRWRATPSIQFIAAAMVMFGIFCARLELLIVGQKVPLFRGQWASYVDYWPSFTEWMLVPAGFGIFLILYGAGNWLLRLSEARQATH